MSEQTPANDPPQLDPALLAIIVCPDCRGDLSLVGAELGTGLPGA